VWSRAIRLFFCIRSFFCYPGVVIFVPPVRRGPIKHFYCVLGMPSGSLRSPLLGHKAFRSSRCMVKPLMRTWGTGMVSYPARPVALEAVSRLLWGGYVSFPLWSATSHIRDSNISKALSGILSSAPPSAIRRNADINSGVSSKLVFHFSPILGDSLFRPKSLLEEISLNPIYPPFEDRLSSALPCLQRAVRVLRRPFQA